MPARVALLQDPGVHGVLIGLATLVTLALGALSLRSFYASGAKRSLALAAGLLAFSAVYVWHGVFTQVPPAFAFLIYGPTARVALGITLPLLLLTGTVARPRRFLASTGVVVGAAILALAAWASHPALASWSLAAGPQPIQAVRLSAEAVAAALGVFAATLLVWTGRKQPTGFSIAVAAAVFLLAVASVYFMFTGPWTVAWWAAHAISATSMLVLTMAVVGELSIAERDVEVRQLREMNAMKTRFINSAAHEIGTPLTPIQLQLSLLRARGDPLTERQQRSLDAIQRNVNRLADLTQSILEGARSQAGRFPVRLEDTDLREMLDEITHSYEPWCEEKGLSFGMVAPDSVPMHTDRRRMHQIVSNFVSNAIKNSEAGGKVLVLARLHPGRIRISVQDSGRGLTDKERRRLFQPFAQLDDATKSVGSGLGLFIARQLAERLGGFVGVDSDGLGHGSTFYVDLPLEAPIDDLRPMPGRPEPPMEPMLALKPRA